jgi:hypothetical protein
LNASIYIVDQILSFPFDLFARRDKTIFFRFVIKNFFEAGLLIITKLATDQGDDVYTLPRFKNKVRESLRPEYKRAFDKWLRNASFGQRTKELFKRATQLRKESVAHAKKDIVLRITEGARLSFQELKPLRDALNSLLATLSFNVDHMLLPIAYEPRVERPQGSKHTTDIQDLLDCMARNSALLNMPEREPTLWPGQRERLTGEQISQINNYRRRLNLPAI